MSKNLVAACFALTAVSYGLGRFSLGLLLPEIREDLALDAALAGWIGSGAFGSYCFGIILSMRLGTRFSEHVMATTAGVCVTCGLALAGVAPSAWILGTAMILAGLGTGLTSSPLTAAVERHLHASARPKANGAVNAGTAVGIVLSGLATMTFPLGWRELYALFAAIAAAVTAWLWFAMPAPVRGSSTSPSSAVQPRPPAMWGLCASAFLMGAGSTAVWTFGATIMRDELGFSNERVTMAWVVLGAAGAGGAATGFLAQRYGPRQVHRLALCLMAVAVAAFAGGVLLPKIAFIVMASFGAAYIVSSGVFLLWGIRLFPGRPASGLGVPFLALAAGQSAGAPIVGTILDAAGTTPALLASAGVIAAAAAWSPRHFN